MGFMNFGGDAPVQHEIPALELGELTARLDGIKEAIERIQVVFEPKIEVPPAQFAMEIDLGPIELALQEIAAKEHHVTNEILLPAPQVTNNVYVTVAQEILYPLYMLTAAGLVVTAVQLASLFK